MDFSEHGVDELVHRNVVRCIPVALDGCVLISTLSSRSFLEIAKVDVSESNFRSPSAIRLNFMNWKLRILFRMQRFSYSVRTKEHKTVLVLTEMFLAIWNVRIVVLAINFNIFHLYLDSLTLSRSLQAYTFLVVDEGHVMHYKMFSFIHSSQATISVFVG